jgi:hypothetical protein
MEPYLGLLQKMNTHYRYDLLSYSYLNSTKDLDILNSTKDFDILNLTKDFDILDSTKDSDILDSTKDSDILDSKKDSDIYGPPVQPYIRDDHDITDREGILTENFIRDIIEEDWKGTDFNIMNGPRSTIQIYDAIRSYSFQINE